jgi:hypothetical protein
MPVKTLRAAPFIPTSPRTGNQSPSLFRATNMLLRGRGEHLYAECYGGSLNLNEEIATAALTGTISFSPASRTITGTSSAFFSELHLGQFLETIAGEVLVVTKIVSDTEFEAASLPLTTASGVAAYRLPVLFEVGKDRGTLLSGNALEFDKGTILAVGSGTLRINGDPLAGTSLVAERNAKIGIYEVDTDNYIVKDLGFPTRPAGITASAASAASAKTFADTDVNTTTNEVTITAHGFSPGERVTTTNPGTLATPLTATAEYVVMVVDANTVKFAYNSNDAANGVAIPLTAAGSGTTTVTPLNKAMPAGDRSIRISKASSRFGADAYGNPGEKIKVTLTAGQRIKIDFPAMDSATDSESMHDAWRIYGTRFGGSTAQATANADSGPWYWVRTVSAEELGGTGATSYYLEYLDAEIDGSLRIITFDNDPPPDAEFVGTVAGYPVLISCQGRAVDADTRGGTSPGAFIVPTKPANIAAAPLAAAVPLSPPEIIIGFYMAAGRLYLLTANTLQIAVFTADADFPVATRPFWKSGFRNPYALCFANDRLYGFTNSPIRSPEEGSDADVDRGFAAFVKEITYDWNSARVFVVHDPINECVCYVYSAAYKNEAGFWVSLVLPFMLEMEAWSPLVILSSDEHDMVVSGTATVNGCFEFLAGGRDGAGGIEVNTYRFDAGLNDGETVPYSMAWQFADDGDEYRPKKVKGVRVTGKLTDADFGIHGAYADEEIDVDTLEAGNAGSKSGAIPLSDSTGVTVREWEALNASFLHCYTPNIAGEWDGAGMRDRIDEVGVEVIIQGARR